MPNPVIQQLEKSMMKERSFDFGVGDTVEVRSKVKEGDKERVQVFIGTVIGRKGTRNREAVIVRRLVQGEGVERTFPLHSPTLVDIRVTHKGEVRRAKLYYLRDRTGKATRIKGRTLHGVEVPGAEAPAAPAAPAAEKPAEEKK
jgi:large subunit ribosomal protein L19